MELKARTPTRLHRATLGPGADSIASIFGQHRFADERVKLEHLRDRYGQWVHRCVTINAQTAAAVPCKLLTSGRSTVERFLPTRPLDAKLKHYLAGHADVKPSASVRKASQNIDDMTEILEHPLLDLLQDVNDWQDGYAYRESLYADLQIFGRAYTHVIAPDGLQPTELWRMMPEKTKVVPDPVNFVRRFEFGDEPDRVNFRVDEVLWFKLFDPWDPWGGYGPTEAWLKTIEASFHITDFQDWLFKQGGVPDYVVLGEAAMNDDQKRAYRNEWRRLYGRMSNRKESLAFLTGRPQPDIKPLNQSPKELEFTQSQLQVRDFIGNAYGVPKSMLTTDDVNRANARESNEVHMRSTIWPMVQRVEDVQNERLAPRFGEGLLLVYQNPVPEDKAIRIQERESLLQSGTTVNEVRAADDMEALDDPMADVPLIASGLVPLGSAGLQGLGTGLPPIAMDGEPRPLETLPQQVLTGPQITAATAIVTAVAQGQLPRDSAVGQLVVMFNLSPEQAEQMLGTVGEGFEPEPPELPQEPGAPMLPGPEDGQAGISQGIVWSKYYTGTLNGQVKQEGPPQADLPFPALLAARVRRVIGSQLRAMAAELTQSGISGAFELLTDEKWLAELIAVMRPAIEAVVTTGGVAALEKLPAGAQFVSFDVRNPAVIEFIDRYVVRLATQVNNSTEIALNRLVDTDLEAGRSVRDISRRIIDLDQSVTGFRAEMIARTESTRAYVAGEVEAWRNSGVVTGKVWILAPEPCQFCQALKDRFGDEPLPLDAAFYEIGSTITGVKGGRMKLDYENVLGPPLHPHCRCDLLPILEGD